MKRINPFLKLVIYIVWMALYFCFFIKIPFYIYMYMINTPAGSYRVDTNVIISDIDGIQIIAETVLCTENDVSYIYDFIHKNNSINKNVKVYDYYRYGSFDYDHDMLFNMSDLQMSETKNYCLIHYSTITSNNVLLYTFVVIGFILGIVMLGISNIIYSLIQKIH